MTYARSINPHAVGTLTARTRELLAGGVRMGTINGDMGREYGPTRADRPVIIAHRYECPSCGAIGGEPCRLNGRFPQEFSHEARHQAARRADWRQLVREMNAGRGPISSLQFA